MNMDPGLMTREQLQARLIELDTLMADGRIDTVLASRERVEIRERLYALDHPTPPPEAA
jgi:hypothetical protein